MKRNFSLDELMMFYEVVSAGSLTKASDHLQVAKSTLSRRLTSLEKQMGTLLLKRSTRKVLPTEVGQELFERCSKLVNEVESLRGLAQERSNTISGVLRVSIPSEFGSRWLGKAIADFALQYPDLHLDIEITTRAVNLIEDPYDVAISFGRLRDSGMASRRLARLSRGLFASQAYLKRVGVPRSVEDLKHATFIVTDVQQREGTLALLMASKRRHVPITARMTVNSMRLARELVLSGVGIAVLPYAMCIPYLNAEKLVPVLPDWRCPPVEATAIVLAREGIPRKTRLFLDFIAKRLQGMEESGAI